MLIGVDSAKPYISASRFGFPTGEKLMAQTSWYRPTLGVGGRTLNVWLKTCGLVAPVKGMVSGPAIRPVIAPTPSMSSLYSETSQVPAVTVVAAPVSCHLTWTSNSSSTSSSEVLSLPSVGSSTCMSSTFPDRMGTPPEKSVAGVWNELDSSGMIFPCLGLLRGHLPRASHRYRRRDFRVATCTDADPGGLIHPSACFSDDRRLSWNMPIRDTSP